MCRARTQVEKEAGSLLATMAPGADGLGVNTGLDLLVKVGDSSQLVGSRPPASHEDRGAHEVHRASNLFIHTAGA